MTEALTPGTTAPEGLSGLTPEQQAVVLARAHAVQVAAGPGTGKTHTLAHLVGHLVREEGVRPERIAVLTFTRDATASLERRLNAQLGKGHLVTVASFHSFCARLLDPGERRFLERSDQRNIMDGLARGLLAHPTQGKRLQRLLGGGDGEGDDVPSRLLGFISYCKNSEVGPAQAVAQQFPNLTGLEDLLTRAFDGYENAKGERKDFDDLLLAVRDRLQGDRAFRDTVAARLDVLLVDEYQDVNRAQHDIVELLTRPESGRHRPRAIVVGDERQAIYGFRGGSPGHLRSFAQRFPDGKSERRALTLNFRSGHALLAAANRMFPDEDALAPPEGTPQGARPRVVGCADVEAEARLVADAIVTLLAQGEDPAGITVLVRSRYLRDGYDKEMAARAGDAAFLAGHRSDALEAADLLLAWFDFVAPDYVLQPATKGVLGRLLHALCAASFDDIATFVDEALAYKEATAAGKKASPPGPRAVQDKFTLLRDARKGLEKRFAPEGPLPVEEMLQAFLKVPWRAGSSARAARILARRLSAALRAHPDRLSERAHLQPRVMEALAADHPETLLPLVKTNTIHAAKGLEWDHVFVLGAREGGIPSEASLNAPDQYRDDLIAEEKRLLYVAVTRARRTLTVTWPGRDGRRSFEASRFLKALGG